ncbi:Uncharacterised protein [Halioglobus japonicus]|nr:Uncharacterised protein [Halioglobus japonicus]
MKTRLSAISIIVLISGCAARQIHSYNDALVEFYSTKVAAADTDDWSRYETATISLENLAREAEEDAEDEENEVNSISLYRISATAAWQSDRTEDVIRIAEKGAELCANGTNADLAPRDCAMLDIIPLLAAIDQNRRIIESLREDVSNTVKGEREVSYGEATVELFGSTERGIVLLLDRREGINPKVSDGYKRVLDQNIEAAAGIYNQTYALLRNTHNIDPTDNGADPTETHANCRALALKNKLSSMSLDAAANKLTPEDENAVCP